METYLNLWNEAKAVISNLLITIFLMAVVVLAVSLVYMFCDQLISMIISVVKELNYRVFKNENQYLFLQYYNGYGEGLLDYNEHHSALRLGIVIKPKFFSEY